MPQMKAKVHLPLQHPMVSSLPLSSDPRGEETLAWKNKKQRGKKLPNLQLDFQKSKSPTPPPLEGPSVWLAAQIEALPARPHTPKCQPRVLALSSGEFYFKKGHYFIQIGGVADRWAAGERGPFGFPTRREEVGQGIKDADGGWVGGGVLEEDSSPQIALRVSTEPGSSLLRLMAALIDQVVRCIFALTGGEFRCLILWALLTLSQTMSTQSPLVQSSPAWTREPACRPPPSPTPPPRPLTASLFHQEGGLNTLDCHGAANTEGTVVVRLDGCTPQD